MCVFCLSNSFEIMACNRKCISCDVSDAVLSVKLRAAHSVSALLKVILHEPNAFFK